MNNISKQYKHHYFYRYNSMTHQYFMTDKHIHSRWTDGTQTILQIARYAKKMGLNQIAITDHIRKDSTYFNKYRREIKKVRSMVDLDILIGFEAKIENFNGDIDVSKKVIEQSQIKIGSVHRFPVGRKLYHAYEFPKKISQEIEVELSVAAIKNSNINVLGHPGAMNLMAFKEFPEHCFETMIKECKINNVAFELNGHYHVTCKKYLIPLLRKYNVLVSLGSDAHTRNDFGESHNELKRMCDHG
ncbi:MAG: PHP domain-containing protein [Elusimicrobia bacterium]|nr:PHP domain-containing protein [Elusimicrobiota bacterium]